MADRGRLDCELWLARRPAWCAAAVTSLLLLISLPTGMGNDEGMWSYIGRIWVEDGLPPYVGAVENKGPAIFELFALSHELFGTAVTPLRVLGALAVAATSLAVCRLAGKVAGPLAGLMALLIFGLVNCGSGVDGASTAHTETFMVLCSTWAAWLLLPGDEACRAPDRNRALAAGLLFGIAISFKQIAVCSLAGGLTLVWYTAPRVQSWTSRLQSLATVLGGTLVGMAACVVPLWACGVGTSDYFAGAWQILFSAGSGPALTGESAGGVWQALSAGAALRLATCCGQWTASQWVFCGTLATLSIVLVWQQRRRLAADRRVVALAVWLAFDMLGVNASGSYYGHQFKQLVPMAAVLASILIANYVHARQASPAGGPARQAWLAVLAVVVLCFPVRSLVTAARQVRSGMPEPSRAVAAWLDAHTKAADRVWTFNQNQVLSYTHRRSPSRYFNEIFVRDVAAEAEWQRDFTRCPPTYVVAGPDSDGRPAPAVVAEFVETYYLPVCVRCGLTIYGRRKIFDAETSPAVAVGTAGSSIR